MTEQSLNLLQHWMRTVITGRGSLREKLDAASEQHGLQLHDVVAEKRGLPAYERLGIYSRGYVLRLLECLREEFPALHNFVGDSVFDAFARAYLISKEPETTSLFDLGQGFPQFLKETKPELSPLDDESSALLDLPSELARLERARSEVLRARGTEHAAPTTASFSPFTIFSEELVLEATPCLRLLELKLPLVNFLRKSDRGERPELEAARPSFIAIGRYNYRIYMEEVSIWQFAFLKACERPSSLYPAVQYAANESEKDTSAVLAELVLWLPVAIEFGFLRRASDRIR